MAFSINIHPGIGVALDEHPEICPRCNAFVEAQPVYAFESSHSANPALQIVYQCPNKACRQFFIGIFRRYPDRKAYYLIVAFPRDGTKREFSEIITKISQNFCDIYNEATLAEQMGWMQICGVGYRKAFEFLIKDYLVKAHPDRKTDIEAKFLGKCISEDIGKYTGD